MVIFGWIGGVTGVTIGTEQINMLVHNTLRLPGHFHATVVSGTTLAFMGFTYYVIPLIFRKELKLKKWATWQPYVFGFGTMLVSLGMITSGLQGLSTVGPGVVVLSASDDKQFSAEGTMFGGGHGAFTHYLLEREATADGAAADDPRRLREERDGRVGRGRRTGCRDLVS